MHNTLLRVDRFLEARWVTEDNTRYNASRYRRVSRAFIRYILDGLIVHYTDYNNVLLAAATLLRNNTHFDEVPFVVLRNTQRYSNPALDTIAYLLEAYENITPESSESIQCEAAAASIETDLYEETLDDYGPGTLYPWSWKRTPLSLYTPPSRPPSITPE